MCFERDRTIRVTGPTQFRPFGFFDSSSKDLGPEAKNSKKKRKSHFFRTKITVKGRINSNRPETFSIRILGYNKEETSYRNIVPLTEHTFLLWL